MVRHKPSALDYVFTDNASLIDQVIDKEPIGKSDHECLEWTLNIPPVEPQEYVPKLNYWKSYYHKMNKILDNINWQEILNVSTVRNRRTEVEHLQEYDSSTCLTVCTVKKPCKKRNEAGFRTQLSR